MTMTSQSLKFTMTILPKVIVNYSHLDEYFMTGGTIAEPIRILHGLDQSTLHKIPKIDVHGPRSLTVIEPTSDVEASCLPSTSTDDSTLEYGGHSSRRKKITQKNPGTSQMCIRDSIHRISNKNVTKMLRKI